MTVQRSVRFRLRDGWPVLVVLLLFWFSRLVALDAMPLHNDEGLHLTRAVEVWHLHPFWQISDGKIINHWLIAVFYPQNAPVFVARFATLLVSLVGLAAGWQIARRLAGFSGALLAASLWLGSGYLLFFERLALSDAQAGALVVVAAAFALRLTATQRDGDALFTGLALAAAILFKFTALPFGFVVVVIVLLLGSAGWRQRLRQLVIMGMIMAACFAVPLAYLLLRGRDFFSIALNWVGGGSYGSDRGTLANLTRLVDQLTGFGLPTLAPLLLVGLIALVVFGRKPARVLLVGAVVPLLTMIVIGTEVLPRHFVVALPLLMCLGGLGLAGLIARLPQRETRFAAVMLVIALLLASAVPFASRLYRAPGHADVPARVYSQYIADHSAGFGLRDAVLSFPQSITRPDLPIIGSMFPDGCRRANFYAARDFEMICTDAPGTPEIEAALAAYGAVYVLTDEAPTIGVDVTQIGAAATRIAVYPRPDETDATASVVLWLLQR